MREFKDKLAVGLRVVCLLTPLALLAQSAAAQAPLLASNHALIITVSEYRHSPLPGVLTDRKLALELAQRFGVPMENVVELAEEQVTREGLRQALAHMNQLILPGDRLYVYFSGHGARTFSKSTGQCTESLVMQDMKFVTNDNQLGVDLKDPHAKDDIQTLNELHVPVNKPVLVQLSSKDVIHSFKIIAQRVCQDAIPGMSIPVWFKPIKEGKYQINCAQLCGNGHYNMAQGFLTVESQEVFDKWMADKARSAGTSATSFE